MSEPSVFTSRYEAFIHSQYHEARVNHFNSPQDSHDFQETRRWMHRSEDLVFEIVKNNQALSEDLGTVWTLFPVTPRLNELIQKANNLQLPKTSKPPRPASMEELERWKDEAKKQLQADVQTNYKAVIEELVAYLAQQLPAD